MRKGASPFTQMPRIYKPMKLVSRPVPPEALIRSLIKHATPKRKIGVS